MILQEKHNEALDLIQKVIKSLELDLKNKIVLTELGSNSYLYLPVIGALSGADKVYAWTRDTDYGLANDLIVECQSILRKINLKDKVEFYNGSLNRQHLQSADVITNSGFLRPFNEEKLQHCKSGAVIPLMYEKWELREGEIDLKLCKQFNIKVAGTNEDHPKIKVFKFVGDLALKMVLDSKQKIKGQNIIVWSDDNFGEVISHSFKSEGANQVIQTTDFQTLKSHILDIDFIFLCDYSEEKDYNDLDFFNWAELLSLNKFFQVVHLYGKINFNKMKSLGIYLSPEKDGLPKIMSRTLAHVGLEPVINLQAGGLKVAEEIMNEKHSELVQPIVNC